MTTIVTDVDEDGWPDIYVACDSTPSILYRNNHDGTFTDMAVERGLAYSEDGREQAGMGLAGRRLQRRRQAAPFPSHRDPTGRRCLPKAMKSHPARPANPRFRESMRNAG